MYVGLFDALRPDCHLGMPLVAGKSESQVANVIISGKGMVDCCIQFITEYNSIINCPLQMSPFNINPHTFL
jgi:hypothetical protein